MLTPWELKGVSTPSLGALVPSFSFPDNGRNKLFCHFHVLGGERHAARPLSIADSFRNVESGSQGGVLEPRTGSRELMVHISSRKQSLRSVGVNSQWGQLVAWNQPWWEYLHHEHSKYYKLVFFPPYSGELIFKHLPAPPWKGQRFSLLASVLSHSFSCFLHAVQ